jgi:hypothetical protein
MSITRAKQSSLRTGVVKYDSFLGGLPYTPTIGTATDGGTGSTVSVAFTGNNTAGLTYTALSSPGSLTGTSTTSPITVSGLSSGTAYTFQVNAANSAGTSAYSAASNSVTPAAPSGFYSIATVTATGGETTITFSSIPGTYKSLQIRGIARDTSTATNLTAANSLKFNGDGTGANYSSHYLRADGTNVTAADVSGNGAVLVQGMEMVSTTSNIFSTFIIDIEDYASTTKNKTVRAFAGGDANGASANIRMGLSSGAWLSTAAVTSISLTHGFASYAAGSTFALYGIQ